MGNGAVDMFKRKLKSERELFKEIFWDLFTFFAPMALVICGGIFLMYVMSWIF